MPNVLIPAGDQRDDHVFQRFPGRHPLQDIRAGFSRSCRDIPPAVRTGRKGLRVAVRLVPRERRIRSAYGKPVCDHIEDKPVRPAAYRYESVPQIRGCIFRTDTRKSA